MNLIEFIRNAKIDDLGLPSDIAQKLREQNGDDFTKIYAAVQSFQAIGNCTIRGLTEEEMKILALKFTDLRMKNGLVKKELSTGLGTTEILSSAQTINTQPSLSDHQGSAGISRITQNIAMMSEKSNTALQTNPSTLIEWENQYTQQLKKVELIGEITVSYDELKIISSLFRQLLQKLPEQEIIHRIEESYPVTFLVFTVGQGIYGYNGGDFWPAYTQALNRSIDRTAFGRLFEKLLRRFNKPLFRDLQERSLRYVSLILAHGGIPIYCLGDFFNNIVLNCAIKPQLFALEGMELVDEVLKHPSYTLNTDKPVLHFLEYGGRTAADLLDRSRIMLLTWQQNQTLLSAEEVGLPAHLIEFFAEWVQNNSALRFERGSRSRLKRPQLSLDPWGLGMFLTLPSQPVSAHNTNDIYWKVEAGTYQEEIKGRTQRKGDQVETRSVTLRLNEVPENILVLFCQGDYESKWIITGYSPDHLLLAFDPVSGYLQNHILAREIWLLYPAEISLSIQKGEGRLLEILPALPGELSNHKLECWDLSKTICLGLNQQSKLVREVYIRSQEAIPRPSLYGGRIVTTDYDENPILVFTGKPPSIRIPLSNTDDLQSELNRWRIQADSIGVSDPEISLHKSLSDLPSSLFIIDNNIATIPLGVPELLNSKPIGTYHFAIKGPLGRDATLSFQILPECEVDGLKELYIPDRKLGPEKVAFTIQTTLLDGVDSLNNINDVIIEKIKPGCHKIIVSAEISSVGILFRRETIHHQYIRLPVYFRIKRLRWRLARDNGLIGSWQQRHSVGFQR